MENKVIFLIQNSLNTKQFQTKLKLEEIFFSDEFIAFEQFKIYLKYST